MRGNRPSRIVGRAARAFGVFRRDRRGTYSVLMALTFPVLVGFAALGTEAGLWFYTHQSMQAAADAAAFSAATAWAQSATATYTGGSSVNTAACNCTAEAQATAAKYGFTDGVNHVTVNVNTPPTQGTHTGTAGAVEVVISQTQTLLLAQVINSSALTITARAVAVQGMGTGCLLALDPTKTVDVSGSGNPTVDLNGCGLYDNSNSATALTETGAATITATGAGGVVSTVGQISGISDITATSIVQGAPAVADPYRNTAFPSTSGSCTDPPGSSGSHDDVKSSQTYSPGYYCGFNIQTNNGNVTLNAGLYVIDLASNEFKVGAGSTLTCTAGCTLAFTSSTGTYPSPNAVEFISGANITLDAATTTTTGPASATGLPSAYAYEGMVIYMDRNAPTGTAVSLIGGGTATINGAVYMPTAAITITGGGAASAGCIQLIGDTVAFAGNGTLSITCTAGQQGTKAIIGPTTLVE